MKKILLILGIIVLSLVVIAIVRDQVIKAVVTMEVSNITGAPVKLSGFSLGLFKQAVHMEGLKIYNPKGFPEGVLVDVAKMNVHYDLAMLLKGKVHLMQAGLDLKEIGLIRNKEGKLNVDALKVTQAKQESGAKAKEPAKVLSFQIDEFKLKMGRVVEKDYSSGAPEPVVTVYDINLEKTYKNITSPQQLVALIITEPMKAAGIQGAQIYAVSALAGVAMLPVAVAATFMGKDSVEADLKQREDNIYGAALNLLKRIGKVSAEDKAGGVINAEAHGASINLKLRKNSNNSIHITVSARKFLLPKPEIASGILYQIQEELKK